MRKDKSTAAAWERVALLAGVSLAIIVIVGGWYLALHLHDPHWMNRAGAAVVALQVCAAMIEFARRNRLRHAETSLLMRLPDKHGRDHSEKLHTFVAAEVAKSESHAFLLVMTLAAVGELLHGFGDLVFEALMH